MKKDMFKIIVERPRVGGAPIKGKKRRQGWNRDIENAPLKESMRKTAALGAAKELNENLAPLIRYIRSNVGRPWNDVFSEICKYIDLSHTVKRHVRQHLDHMVATKTFLRDGNVWESSRYESVVSEHWTFERFYVHPETGLLCKSKHVPPPWKIKKDRTDLFWIKTKKGQPRKALALWKGIWYECEVKDLPKEGIICVRDVLTGSVYWSNIVNWYRNEFWGNKDRVYCSSKKSASSKLIKQYSGTK